MLPIVAAPTPPNRPPHLADRPLPPDSLWAHWRPLLDRMRDRAAGADTQFVAGVQDAIHALRLHADQALGMPTADWPLLVMAPPILDHTTRQWSQGAFTTLRRVAVLHVGLDCSRSQTLSPDGLGGAMAAWRTLRETGGSVTIAGLHGSLAAAAARWPAARVLRFR